MTLKKGKAQQPQQRKQQAEEKAQRPPGQGSPKERLWKQKQNQQNKLPAKKIRRLLSKQQTYSRLNLKRTCSRFSKLLKKEVSKNDTMPSFGSPSSSVQSSCRPRQDSMSQQVKSSTPIRLAFEQLEAIDLTLRTNCQLHLIP